MLSYYGYMVVNSMKYRLLWSGGWLLLLVLSLVLFAIPVTADIAPNWTTSPTFQMSRIRDVPAGQLVPYSINGNRDCQNQTVLTRPARAAQSKISLLDCAVDTQFGSVSTSGYLRRPGTEVWGRVMQPSGVAATVIPVPRSDIVIQYVGGPVNSLYLNFTKQFSSKLRSNQDPFGQVTHTITGAPDGYLKDRSGQQLPAVIDSLAFSASGSWMVVDIRAVGMVRVNLETFQVTPFAGPFNYDIGLSPGIQSAISSDGRFAVVASQTFGRFTVYDLSTCAAVPDHITQKVSCQSHEFNNYLGQQISGLQSFGTIRFLADNILNFYARYRDAQNNSKVSQFALGLPGADGTGYEYLALGDSYTSGEGAYQYKSYTDTPVNRCHLSLVSYPYLIAKDLSSNHYESVACSGARMKDVLSPSHYRPQYVGKETAGFDDDIFSNFLVGYRPQGDFVSRYHPAIVTFSVFGNDTGLPAHLKECMLPSTCFANYEDRLELFNEINGKFDQLVTTLTEMQRLSVPQTKLYVVDYPEIFAPNGNCALNVRLSKTEMQTANSLVGYLDSVMKLAAAKTGVRFIDVQHAFDGHRLCESTDSAVNGLTTGDDSPWRDHGPVGNESYHPTALGQRLLSAVIEGQIAEQFAKSPWPDTSAALSMDITTSNLLQNAAPASGRPMNHLTYVPSLSPEMLTPGQKISVHPDTEVALKPNTGFHISLGGSQIIDLGSISSDAQGIVSGELSVPKTVPEDVYRLSVSGPNVNNEPVTLYSVISVNNPIMHQNVYRLRISQGENGERTGRLFLERNRPAAVAQLQINDYVKGSGLWAIVGSTPEPTKQTVLGLVLLDHEGGNIVRRYPIIKSTTTVEGNIGDFSEQQRKAIVPAILVQQPNGRCQLLVPPSIGVVKNKQSRWLHNPPRYRNLSCQ